MRRLGFLCLLRDAGDAAARLCTDIAAVAQPGDEVILVDDTGGGANFHTTAVVRNFAAMRGWPDDLRVEVISTGTRGTGDLGAAINIALDHARADHLLILPGTARLAPGLDVARAQAASHDLLTCAVMAPDIIAPKTPSAHLSRLLFSQNLVRELHCVEGRDAGGYLPLLAGLLAHAQTPGQCSEVIAALPPLPRATPDWLALWEMHLPDEGLITEALEGAAVGTGHIVAAALSRAYCRPKLAAPAPLKEGPLQVMLSGPHARRSPFSYEGLRPLWQDRIEIITDPNKADALLFSHPWDVRDMPAEVAQSIEKRPNRPCALFSEEPFWDTLFSPDPLARRVTLPAGPLGQVSLAQINHHTSPIFDFDHIPYFLLTDAAYAPRYAKMFSRNAARSPQDWQADFADRATQAVFMAERRPERFHNLRNAAGGLTGLCAWRTHLAEIYQTGTVARCGASWQDGVPVRQALDDWHADKLAQLDGTARIISGLENTHQPTYLSEKLFDAFACGARPLYFAEPAHRLWRMDLPPEAWINLADHTPGQAVETIDAAPWDLGFFENYALAQKRLAALWSDRAKIAAEKQRLSRALAWELDRLTDG